MSKLKALEYKKVEALSFVGDIEDVSEYDNEYIENDKDKIELEKLIYFLSAEEISILVLRHLGYKPIEICKIMHLHSLAVYRKLYRSLKMRIYLYKNIHNIKKELDDEKKEEILNNYVESEVEETLEEEDILMTNKL